MMRKTFSTILLVSTLVLVLSAGVMAEEEIELTVAAGSVGQELELTEEAAERFEEEHPNVEVEVLDTPELADDRRGLYLQYLEAESAKVDVYQIDVIWPGELASHFVDLNEYGAEEVADEHFDPIIENNTVDGELVAIPWFTDAGLLYYRTDLLEEYGYDGPPETWEELEEMAKTIQEGEREDNEDFWGYVWQGDVYEGLTCNALEWIHSNGGGTIINDDQEITINNEKAVEAIEMAADWPGEISPNGVVEMAEESARKHWEAGNAAFMRNWPFAYPLGNEEDKEIAGKFDVAPLPAGDRGQSATLGGWNLAVSKYSEHTEEAAELALFMASYEEQKIRAVEGSFQPTIEELYEDEDVIEANPFFERLYDVFVNAVPRPSTPTGDQYSEVSELSYQAIHDVITGEEDAQSALEYLELELIDKTGFAVDDVD
ncbi:MAG: ABC transporter substrate-binding protein [Halanaerobiales bacterium]